ncbi:uncharacterized protein TNCV_3971721 [Trichonephila clavipes]|nr:uncharacterized protein TNCV_3971721 [Trichonephila clavipes]
MPAMIRYLDHWATAALLADKRETCNDDHRREINDLAQSIPGFQECDEEDVETSMTCDAEDCGFQMLYDNEIATSLQESDPVDDETDEDENKYNQSSKGPLYAVAFSELETAME